MSRETLLLVLALGVGCARRPAPEAETPNVVVTAPVTDNLTCPVERHPGDVALANGVEFLLRRQSPDGAWRSDVYAAFKDGTALTPFALVALQNAHDAGVQSPAVEAAIRKGAGWLAQFSNSDGTVSPNPDGFDYPIYTATLAIKVFSHPTAYQFLLARDGWVKYVKERQLTESLGWKRDEKQYGGWGYCRVIPKKPEPDVFAPPLIESNLSATVFALDALRIARELDADTEKAAMVFVRRCQNKDGGFHFIYDDPTRNKAGMAPGTPPTFHSYGSTTADGMRALSCCATVDEGGRLSAATDWLSGSFRAETHPGNYVKPHEANREAVYFYYAASVARAFRSMKISLPDKRNWAAELTAELVRRQTADGSWQNAVELVRENDPMVATCHALAALSEARLAAR